MFWCRAALESNLINSYVTLMHLYVILMRINLFRHIHNMQYKETNLVMFQVVRDKQTDIKNRKHTQQTLSSLWLSAGYE